MMEIGSFIELDLKQTGEYFNSDQTARLNSGRCGIYYSLLLLGLKKIYIPYYQCPSVSLFLQRNGIEVIKYHINEDLLPSIAINEKNSGILIVNYFGLFNKQKLAKIANKYNHVIIDNSQAFFTKPIEHYLNVYSPRKFFGVADGCYVIGKNAKQNEAFYQRDLSSETSAFLFKRIELGCNAAYAERQKNEARIEHSDIKRMSLLTESLLSNIDYRNIKRIRRSNFEFAHNTFKSLNDFQIDRAICNNTTPMVYPLVIKQENLINILRDRKIYTGRWWNHVLNEVDDSKIEYQFSKYMIPIPIDQRYGEAEIEFIHSVIKDNI